MNLQIQKRVVHSLPGVSSKQKSKLLVSQRDWTTVPVIVVMPSPQMPKREKSCLAMSEPLQSAPDPLEPTARPHIWLPSWMKVPERLVR